MDGDAPVLCTEAFLNAKDVAERGQARLEIELRGLRQVRWLAIVIELEEGSASLDLSLDEAGRGNLEEIV